MSDEKLIDERLQDYDWRSAFEYAGDQGAEEHGTYGSPDLRPVPPGVAVSTRPFGRADVAEIKGMAEGENEGPDWLCCGTLNDGRYFMLRAGCDYTGWDCQASGHADVATGWQALLRYGMTLEEAQRMNVERPRFGDE